jgi:hypothetical protein
MTVLFKVNGGSISERLKGETRKEFLENVYKTIGDDEVYLVFKPVGFRYMATGILPMHQACPWPVVKDSTLNDLLQKP